MLEVKGLDTYYLRARILAEVELSVASGEVAVLLGRNGAGKSTTLKSIMGMVPSAAGEITFLGQSIRGLPVHAISRMGLGYVPEDRRVFPQLTVLENLEVGRQPPREGCPEWTPEKLFEVFPNLERLQHRPGGQTSGGEQQMLTVARTLMGNPRLILLDEPSEGLAPVVVEQMAETITALKDAGLSILLSEQNLRFASAISDRAYIIERGEIKYHGTMQELSEDREVYEAYLSV